MVLCVYHSVIQVSELRTGEYETFRSMSVTISDIKERIILTKIVLCQESGPLTFV